ncbi:MAG: exodeoxyribonuclease VII large subunit [Candidatus Hydrogenedens sp.]
MTSEILDIEQRHIWSVSELNRKIRDLLEEEIGYIWLNGEISNWRVAPSGHAYFTLKDADSEITSAMFRSYLQNIRFQPENGMEVLVYGQITVYEKRGTHQIIVEQMEPKGIGALQLAFEQLKKKLEAEGLFDPAHKKKLPILPKVIGIVTSPSGAAIRDILKVLSRRFANIHVILYPARVQGKEASSEIVAGIQYLDQYGVDVIIVGRGGGSIEDLWSFNEEIVVRAVYNAKTPIISAVGHEIDFTLTDFSADVRAPTPSAAAEMVIQDQTVLWDTIQTRKQKLVRAIKQIAQRYSHRLELAQQRRGFQSIHNIIRDNLLCLMDYRKQLEDWWEWEKEALHSRIQKAMYALQIMSPQSRIQSQKEKLDYIKKQLEQKINVTFQDRKSKYMFHVAKLEALSPLKVLGRGYALVWLEPEHKLVRCVEQLGIGNSVKMQFSDGIANAIVKTIEHKKDEQP